MSNVWSWKVDISITWFTIEKEAGHSYFLASRLYNPSTSNQAVGSNRTNRVCQCWQSQYYSEILPAEAAAIEWRQSLHQSIIMLHSNHYDSFLSNPKTWQRSILLDVSRAKSGLFCQGWCMVHEHCPWLTIMMYQILFFVYEFCVKLLRKSCKNEYIAFMQHLEALPQDTVLLRLPLSACSVFLRI